MLTLTSVAIQLLLTSAVKAQVTTGQTFPGGVIVSVNPGGQPTTLITTQVPGAPNPKPDPEPEPAPEQKRDPEQIAIDSLCTGQLNQDSWDAANMNDFVQNTGTNFSVAIQALGFQKALIEKVPQLVADGYVCGVDQPCELAILNRACPTNPQVVSLLKAMANWSNFWQVLRSNIGEQADVVQRNAASFQDLFNPQESEDGQLDANRGARIGTASLQLLLGLFSPFGKVKDTVGFIGQILGVFQPGQEPPEDGFDGFADVSRSAGAVERATIEGLITYVQDSLNSETPWDEGGIIDQIAPGGFAEDQGDLDRGDRQSLLSTFAAPAINKFLNEQRLVVIGITSEQLEIIGCEGENFFKSDEKVCENDNKMFLIRRIGDTETSANLGDREDYDPEGIDNLDEFLLSQQDVIEASIRNQEAEDKYFAVAEDSGAFIDRITSKDPQGVDLRDSLFFNLPFCDASDVEITDTQRETCNRRFNSDPMELQMCILNTFLLCGCPSQDVGGESWPYDTSESLQCVLQ